jgi:hypothetical protein
VEPGGGSAATGTATAFRAGVQAACGQGASRHRTTHRTSKTGTPWARQNGITAWSWLVRPAL